MLKKYHVITTKQKFVIYGHSGVQSVKAMICKMLLCPESSIISIREL